MVNMVIVIEGGLIQSIYTDDEKLANADVLVVDYDTDGVESKDLFVNKVEMDCFTAISVGVEYDPAEVKNHIDAPTVDEDSEENRDVDGVQERIGIKDKDGNIRGGDL